MFKLVKYRFSDFSVSSYISLEVTPRQRHRDLSQASQKVLSAVAEPSADKPFLHPKHLLITVSQDESPASGGKEFPRKHLYDHMNLKHLITPKNDDGSIDHRYVPIAKAIAELAGKRVEAQLYKLYVETNKLEKESATAGLQLVIALFSVPMDERFERSNSKSTFVNNFKRLVLRSQR